MPRLFCRELCSKVKNKVHLVHPKKNDIEVSVMKIDERVYLNHGGQQIQSIYNLKEGGYVWLYYVNETEFMLEVFERWLEKVKYRFPLKDFKLGDIDSPIDVLEEDDNQSDKYAEREQPSATKVITL